ncbi:bifunctional 4-hydroxy-2-oxoglutarate aldolase/2-dehydro-3-deoxy-phosphogluconate aldolase [Lacihabitans sp. LS3-19]|uniref:bifunctional 4-hydroxy-2-oxoglutarate aldolase/2-dehydro-3-deoxy-phosphogluconate aldolase n=1 Tax=Lacihabitans sp. LS3-19 TaxID=2487335 RepID=UPI0020CFD6BA|nr:bifunctional 4-hydroxy-2-oxoglutarate aldolase/2-dehydro-3-deoxy-phosphogluconate aldolase [Lacihabitans sp. LS3-19]MCP9770549.1 bifunctional 4-hydroxy-2-oxoglutarate aldolase/2-dehydro-3-deoxy-phosphogluconate aldolase [Lacihabitans sp. LS3-19]
MTKEDILKLIIEKPLVPVFYSPDLEHTKNIIQACYEGGIRVFEFTNRGILAKTVFAALVPYVKQNFPEMILGIGTIVDAKTAEDYIAMGADFIVQPGTTKEVGDVCVKHNIAWIPGVLTPTEIYQALAIGADAVKIFPGSVVGSAYVKALRGPMPDVKIMVTGGVEPTEASLKEWFGAGANAVGLGSQLFKDFGDIDVFKNKVKELFTYIQP